MAAPTTPAGFSEVMFARMTKNLSPAAAAALRAIAGVLPGFIEDSMNPPPGPPPGVRNNTDKIYIRTGRLLGSFVPASGAGRDAKGRFSKGASKGENVTTVTVSGKIVTLRVGSLVPYARVHEFGSDNIPARPYLQPAIEKLRANLDNILGPIIAREVTDIWRRS